MEPLGFIDLPAGKKPIMPMNDIFINYMFQHEKYWQALKQLTNLFYGAFLDKHLSRKISLVHGNIHSVVTQFPHFKDPKSAAKKQDMCMESDDQIDFLEFQNDTHPTQSLEERSVQYYGYSLSYGKAKPKTTLWLINGGVTGLLNKKEFANFVFKDEVDGYFHPAAGCTLYVDLRRVSQSGDSPVADLAKFLIGEASISKYQAVFEIIRMFNDSFEKFKKDTEVKNIMTYADYNQAIGKNEERNNGIKVLIESLKAVEVEMNKIKKTLMDQYHLCAQDAEEYLKLYY